MEKDIIIDVEHVSIKFNLSSEYHMMNSGL